MVRRTWRAHRWHHDEEAHVSVGVVCSFASRSRPIRSSRRRRSCSSTTCRKSSSTASRPRSSTTTRTKMALSVRGGGGGGRVKRARAVTAGCLPSCSLALSLATRCQRGTQPLSLGCSSCCCSLPRARCSSKARQSDASALAHASRRLDGVSFEEQASFSSTNRSCAICLPVRRFSRS